MSQSRYPTLASPLSPRTATVPCCALSLFAAHAEPRSRAARMLCQTMPLDAQGSGLSALLFSYLAAAVWLLTSANSNLGRPDLKGLDRRNPERRRAAPRVGKPAGRCACPCRWLGRAGRASSNAMPATALPGARGRRPRFHAAPRRCLRPSSETLSAHPAVAPSRAVFHRLP